MIITVLLEQSGKERRNEEPRMTQHVNIKVTGQVQGVYFRASAREVAERLRLKGFVRNQSDGSVYLEVEGDPAQIEKMVSWCKQGPPSAKVSLVEVREGEVADFDKFSITG